MPRLQILGSAWFWYTYVSTKYSPSDRIKVERRASQTSVAHMIFSVTDFEHIIGTKMNATQYYKFLALQCITQAGAHGCILKCNFRFRRFHVPVGLCKVIHFILAPIRLMNPCSQDGMSY